MNLGRIAAVVASMITLAALDFVGAICAKEYADRHRVGMLVLGLATFVALFVVYAVALRYAELSIVTMGWIVLLQVGLIALDWQRYGLRLDGRQGVAVAGILLLQCYLIVSTSSPRPDDQAAGPVPSSHGGAPNRNLATATSPSTPYLVVDLAIIDDRYDRLAAALPGVGLHYAVKANPTPEVLSTLVARGAAFDVASPAEIDAVLAAGASPRDLSYGNTVKKERDIEYAFARGVRTYTFDDPSELAKLRRAAPGATVLCRLATSGSGADWALSEKFGCTPESARDLLEGAWFAGHPVGLAFHVGSQQRDPHQWDEPLRMVGGLQNDLRARGVPLSVLNLGGGFPGSYRQPTPPIEAYGRAIMAGLATHLDARGLTIIAEPGRYLVADAGVIDTEVVLVADRGDARWVYLDIGLFGGLAEALDESIQYRIEVADRAGPVGPVVLAGPTCDSVDVLYRRARYVLPMSVTAGDRVRLHATGAYTATYSSVGFNGLPPLSTKTVRSVRAEPRSLPALVVLPT